ncbi:MAG: hypothetical protein Q8861_01975 [Bacteroidota bacterium]|nr:hypothetical protein [Bacteroidota bacterium]
MANENALPTEVILSDGRTAKKREVVKVRELAAAGNQPKGKEYLIPYATIAAKITIDDKVVVLEDILELVEEDLELISSMFVAEEDLKNA